MHLALPVSALSQSGMHLSPSERHRRLSVSLGKLVARLGRAAFPSLRHNLTPYVFRHAFAADLKVAGQCEPEIIAKALGHQSTRTQEHYGLKSSTRALNVDRARQIIAVTATSPIRNPERPGVAPTAASSAAST